MKGLNTGLDLTQGNNFRNLITLSLPIMISNFMQTFFNLTDTFWLGKLGEGARDAVSVAGIAFPIIFFFSSFGMGLAVAGTALISQYRGSGQTERIREVTGQFLLILTLFALLFIVVSLLSMEPLLRLLQTPAEILPLAIEYMRVTIIGVLFMFTFLAYQAFCHGLGDSVTPMKIQLFTLTLNVIIDPIFIFGFWIFPRFETMGAAYATFFCRFLSVLLAVYYFRKKTPQFIPHRKEFLPRKYYLYRILRISIPAAISQSSVSFGFLVLQGFVNSYGTVVISINAIGNRMVSFFMMPAMGLSNGLAAIVGQNLGANNIERVKKSIFHALGVVMLIMVSGGLFMFFFGGELTKFFIADPEVIEVGNRMFRITAVAATFFAILFVIKGVFNGSGHTWPTMILNITRFWVFRVPLVYIMSGRIMDIAFFDQGFIGNIMEKMAQPLAQNPYDALWWSMLFSNIMSASLGFIILKQGKWKTKRI